MIQARSACAEIMRKTRIRGGLTPAFHGLVKPQLADYVALCAIGWSTCARGHRYGCDRSGHHRVCRALAEHVRRAAFDVSRQFLAAAMRDGCAALHRAMGGRTSEMDGGEMALRVSAQQRKNLKAG